MRALRERLGGAWRARWERWMRERIPPRREVLLTQKNIFIMPSAAGLVFLALLTALLIAGINFENNLAFAITFWLGGMFVVGILHTYANLAGLRLSASAGAPVFAGERAAFAVRLQDSASRCHDALELHWPLAGAREARLPAGGEDLQTLYLPTSRRGWFRPGRLRLLSLYPLGLIRAWTWLDLDLACLVYPRPAASGALPLAAGRGEEGFPTREAGAEDFSGFRNYAPGDPLRHVAWRTLAKGQPLQSREYVAFADRCLWLDWDSTAGAGGVEERLSLLCRWVLELHAEQAQFGLLLPGTRIEPGSGEAHRDRALAALALFGLPEGAPA